MKLVRLNGSPLENGRTLGRAGRAALRVRIRQTRRIQKAHRIADSLLAARVRDFVRVLKRVDKTWLDEAAGMAEGAGVAFDDLLMLNCLPDKFYTPGDNCSGFISVGATENGLFKIRDARPWIQCFLIACARGRTRYHAARDIGNLGIAHCFNQHALAGANHSGSYSDRVPDRVALDDCQALRYFAENAASVQDIPKLYEHLMELGVAGCAEVGRGAIYAFADSRQGLILETVSDAYSASFVGAGVHVVTNHFRTPKAKEWVSKPPNESTLLRRRRLVELLRRRGNAPTPLQVFAISRDRKNGPFALCNDNRAHFWMTLSAQLQSISRKAPESSVNCVCCGNTRHSLYVPVPLAATESFPPLLNGSFYRSANRLYRAHSCSSHLKRVQSAFESAMMGRDDYALLYAEALNILRRAEEVVRPVVTSPARR